MARYGAAHPCFAPFEGAEPVNALPNYGEMFELGGLMEANLTVKFAQGKVHSNNRLAIQVDEFVDGTIAMETDDLSLKDAALIYGATIEDGELVHNVEDSSPYGGLGYYVNLIRPGSKEKFYRAYYFPKVQAVMGNDNAQTKGETINLNAEQITFTVFAPNINNGDWLLKSEFKTPAEALAWIHEKLGHEEEENGNP